MEKTIIEEIVSAPLSLKERLSWFLSATIQGGVPQSMVDPCYQALVLAQTGGDLSTLIELPDGVTFRGNKVVTAQEVIDGHYLADFL